MPPRPTFLLTSFFLPAQNSSNNEKIKFSKLFITALNVFSVILFRLLKYARVLTGTCF